MYTKINERILYSFSVKSSKCGMYFILTSKSQFGLATFQILSSHVYSLVATIVVSVALEAPK